MYKRKNINVSLLMLYKNYIDLHQGLKKQLWIRSFMKLLRIGILSEILFKLFQNPNFYSYVKVMYKYLQIFFMTLITQIYNNKICVQILKILTHLMFKIIL